MCWALIPRGVCLTHLVTLYSLRHQILAICGSRGIQPCAHLLDAIHRDLPNQRLLRLARFPSVLWLCSDDRAILRCCDVGIGGAVIGMLLASPLGALCAWVMVLSLFTVTPEWTSYPWDCLLMEAGALTVLLPSWGGVPSWPVAWCWRWLLFRVMFGMGKKKFGWGWWEHPLYIKWFLVWQVTFITTVLLTHHSDILIVCSHFRQRPLGTCIITSQMLCIFLCL